MRLLLLFVLLPACSLSHQLDGSGDPLPGPSPTADGGTDPELCPAPGPHIAVTVTARDADDPGHCNSGFRVESARVEDIVLDPAHDGIHLVANVCPLATRPCICDFLVAGIGTDISDDFRFSVSAEYAPIRWTLTSIVIGGPGGWLGMVAIDGDPRELGPEFNLQVTPGATICGSDSCGASTHRVSASFMGHPIGEASAGRGGMGWGPAWFRVVRDIRVTGCGYEQRQNGAWVAWSGTGYL